MGNVGPFSTVNIFILCHLTDLMTNNKRYKKFGLIPLSRAIIKERLRWLEYVLRIKGDTLVKIVLFNYPSATKQKAGRL